LNSLWTLLRMNDSSCLTNLSLPWRTSVSRMNLKSQSELLYDRRLTANHFILAPSPLRLTTRFSFSIEHLRSGARGSVVGWGTMLQSGSSLFESRMRWIFFNLPNPCSRTMALGSTQLLTEMSTRKFPGGKKAAGAYGWQPCRHVWAECLKMWKPQPLATLRASTACTGIALSPEIMVLM
jgi:hypothetical protein